MSNKKPPPKVLWGVGRGGMSVVFWGILHQGEGLLSLSLYLSISFSLRERLFSMCK